MTAGDKVFFSVAALYIAMMVVTFGHAAANNDRCVGQVTSAGHNTEASCRLISGLFKAPFWPLYWSWGIAERMKGDENLQ